MFDKKECKYAHSVADLDYKRFNIDNDANIAYKEKDYD
jgi:hypothetical protein